MSSFLISKEDILTLPEEDISTLLLHLLFFLDSKLNKALTFDPYFSP
jgi:hypothetical protein